MPENFESNKEEPEVIPIEEAAMMYLDRLKREMDKVREELYAIDLADNGMAAKRDRLEKRFKELRGMVDDMDEHRKKILDFKKKSQKKKRRRRW